MYWIPVVQLQLSCFSEIGENEFSRSLHCQLFSPFHIVLFWPFFWTWIVGPSSETNVSLSIICTFRCDLKSVLIIIIIMTITIIVQVREHIFAVLIPIQKWFPLMSQNWLTISQNSWQWQPGNPFCRALLQYILNHGPTDDEYGGAEWGLDTALMWRDSAADTCNLHWAVLALHGCVSCG